MGLTEEERFRFDLTGFLVRPSVLTSAEVAAITAHVERLMGDWESIPPHLRGAPTGPAEILIDHPRVIDVLHDIIGPDIRLEGSFAVLRHKGEDGGQPLHQGGRLQADPIFGYRVQEGRIFAGMVRVVFELTDVDKSDGATQFLIGSHKSNFPLNPEHLSLEGPGRSEFLTSYTCPAGSAVFFTENVLHAGAPWRRDTPRVAVLNAYSHLATRFARPILSTEILAGMSPERRAYFREPWVYDFASNPVSMNTQESFLEGHRNSPLHGYVDTV